VSTTRTARARVARRTAGVVGAAVLVGVTMAGCGVTADSLAAGSAVDPGTPSADRFEAAIEATEAEERYTFDATLAVDMVMSTEELDLSGAVDRGAVPHMVVRFDSAEMEAEIRIRTRSRRTPSGST
jgi:hypothetical protein